VGDSPESDPSLLATEQDRLLLQAEAILPLSDRTGYSSSTL